MIRLTILGMSCAACSARVESVLSKVRGVSSVSVNLLTNSAQVEGSPSLDELVASVRSAGYDARREDEEETAFNTVAAPEIADSRRSALRKQLTTSAVFLLALFYCATGTEMLNLPVPKAIDNPGSLGVVQLCLASVVVFINRRFFLSGFASIKRLNPNMDALVALGSGISFFYSLAVLLAVIHAYSVGDVAKAAELGSGYYFESSAAILVFVGIGKALEERAKGKTTSAFESLSKLAPAQATVIRDGAEVEIDAKDIVVGDLFVVRPGQRIPADGTVFEGNSAVDESALTGESVPVDKASGSDVFAGTLNSFGFLRCAAKRIGKDTTLAKIVQLTLDAAASKAPVARLVDKIARIFVPAVIGLAAFTVLFWILSGKDWQYALIRGITVLTISCPCALGLATPAAIMVGMGVGARRGILFKTSESLENCGKVKTVAFDKTGVVTTGRPVVTDFVTAPEISIHEFFDAVDALESQSEHPLATAAVNFVREQSLERSVNPTLGDFQIFPGNGLSGIIDGETLVGGKPDFVSQFAAIPNAILDKLSLWEEDGNTAVCFARQNRFLGAMALADTVKPESGSAISDLKQSGFNVALITGDSKRVAESIGKQVGIDDIVADVLPDGKEKKIQELARLGSVAFVGDGINDAPALARANVGIAVGAGSDVALDAADVVLVSNRLDDVCAAVRLSQKTMQNIRENLFWAFCYNALGMPLAAGFLTPFFGWTFSPAFGAFAMSMSSLCVVSNALRLNLVKLDKPRRQKRPNSEKASLVKKEEESIPMKKTMKISGMMCGHCEARVKKTLEAIPFVESAQVDHTKGLAVVELKDAPKNADEILKESVVAQGYEVTEVA